METHTASQFKLELREPQLAGLGDRVGDWDRYMQNIFVGHLFSTDIELEGHALFYTKNFVDLYPTFSIFDVRFQEGTFANTGRPPLAAQYGEPKAVMLGPWVWRYR